MTDPPTHDQYRKPGPQDVPDLAAVSEQAAFNAMSAKSQEDVTTSAERWRNGLAGLTTIITGGLLIKGPANATDLEVTWRAVLTGLFGLGIAASIAGLWLALRASAGVPTTLRFDQLRRGFGTVRLYQLDVARLAERDLRRAKAAALVAIGLFAIAVFTWWWAPMNNANRLTVTVKHGGEQSCGTIVDSGASGLRLAVVDNPTRVTIPWASITEVKPTKNCGSSA